MNQKSELERQRDICQLAIDSGNAIGVVEWLRSEEIPVEPQFNGIILAHKKKVLAPEDEIADLEGLLDYLYFQSDKYGK